jgi:hypothetical protein
MEENMKGNGLIIVCMDKVFIHGLMEESIKEVIFRTKKKDTVNIHG